VAFEVSNPLINGCEPEERHEQERTEHVERLSRCLGASVFGSVTFLQQRKGRLEVE
jgi:hypothetical protein